LVVDEKRKFLEVLRIEIDDLAEDVAALEALTRGRGATGEITDYVLRENVAVLERELRGVAAVRACLAAVRAEDYAALDDLLDALRLRLADRIRCGGFDPVVRSLVERKIAKVASYVRQHLVPASPAGGSRPAAARPPSA
jgi:hypothetical protein